MTARGVGPATLGAHLRQSRERAGLSQDALGEALGTARRTIIRWEKDQMVPGGRYREELIRELNLPDDVFERYGKAARQEVRLERRVAVLEGIVTRIEQRAIR